MTFLQHLWRNTELKSFVIRGAAFLIVVIVTGAIGYLLLVLEWTWIDMTLFTATVCAVYCVLEWLYIEHRKWSADNIDRF